MKSCNSDTERVEGWWERGQTAVSRSHSGAAAGRVVLLQVKKVQV